MGHHGSASDAFSLERRQRRVRGDLRNSFQHTRQWLALSLVFNDVGIAMLRDVPPHRSSNCNSDGDGDDGDGDGDGDGGGYYDDGGNNSGTGGSYSSTFFDFEDNDAENGGVASFAFATAQRPKQQQQQSAATPPARSRPLATSLFSGGSSRGNGGSGGAGGVAVEKIATIHLRAFKFGLNA